MSSPPIPASPRDVLRHRIHLFAAKHQVDAEARNASLPPSSTILSLGRFSKLPIPVSNHIFRLALAHKSPVRVRMVRQQKGQPHGQNFAIIALKDDRTFSAMLLTSKCFKQAALWNYLHANFDNDLEIITLWTAPPIIPALRVKNFATYLTHMSADVKITFLVKQPSRSIDWAGEILICKPTQDTLTLRLSREGEFCAEWESLGTLEEDKEIGSVIVRSHPVWMGMKKELIGKEMEREEERWDVWGLWRVGRMIEEAGKVYPFGGLV